MAITSRRKHSSVKRVVLRKKSSRRHAVRQPRGSRTAVERRGGGSQTNAAGSPGVTQKPNGDPTYAAAIKNFEAAVRHFQRRNYDKAKEIFEKLAQTAPLGVADRAKVHLRLCGQRLAPASRPLKTAEDYYVAGVSALNARHLDRAVECLGKSAKLDPKGEEIHYTLAAAYALQGMAGPAIEHLKVSIELRPQNLFQARADEDLRCLSSDPRFNHLLGLEPAAAATTGA